MDITSRRLRELGGAGRRQDLGRVAGAQAALVSALERGVVVRPARGVYALAGAPVDAVAAATHGAAIGCVSAVARHGVAVLTQPAVPHLSVPGGRGRRPSGARAGSAAVLHRETWVPTGRAEGVAVASIDDALARMLLCAAPVEALVSVDSALNKGRTTVARIRASLPATASHAARVVLSQADGRSMSPLETISRVALRAAGLEVTPGPLVPRVGYVDLVVEGRVVVELDGFEFHSSRRQFQDDRRRDRELVAQGYLVLRFTAWDVMHDIDRLVTAVLAACARVGRRPIPPHL